MNLFAVKKEIKKIGYDFFSAKVPCSRNRKQSKRTKKKRFKRCQQLKFPSPCCKVCCNVKTEKHLSTVNCCWQWCSLMGKSAEIQLETPLLLLVLFDMASAITFYTGDWTFIRTTTKKRRICNILWLKDDVVGMQQITCFKQQATESSPHMHLSVASKRKPCSLSSHNCCCSAVTWRSNYLTDKRKKWQLSLTKKEKALEMSQSGGKKVQ